MDSMRAAIALLFASSFLGFTQPASAADVALEWASNAYTKEGLMVISRGSSASEAKEAALRDCQKHTDDCTVGLAAPRDWYILLMSCPSVGLVSIGFSRNRHEFKVGDEDITLLSVHEFFNQCIIRDESLPGLTVKSWLETVPAI